MTFFREIGRRLFPLWAQVWLLWFVVWKADLEGRHVAAMLAVVAAGFCAHTLVPAAWRLPLFVATGVSAFGFAAGWATAGLVAALALVLVGLLSGPWGGRIKGTGLLVLGAGALGLRALPGPAWLAAAWPVVGSVFMFRAAMLAHFVLVQRKPASPWLSLGYFLMPPNGAFLLFPLVDFGFFSKGRPAESDRRVWEQGIFLMIRGVLHLFVYRLLYSYVATLPQDVRTGRDLLFFLMTGLLLYVRISGQFHLIVGCLHLFGFGLPETHRNYFLAGNVADFWRRINLYWKDFMARFVYFPCLLRSRSLGPRRAAALATAAVFAATWALHSYQWYWLRGSPLFSVSDMTFWAILGGVSAISAYRQSEQGSSRGSPLGVAMTFGFLCLLWSFWYSTPAEWWGAVRRVPPAEFLPWGAAAFAGMWILGRAAPALDRMRKRHFRVMAVVPAALALGLAIFTQEGVQGRLPGPVASFLIHLTEFRLNYSAERDLTEGYYEGLVNAGPFQKVFWDHEKRVPEGWERSPIAVKEPNFMGHSFLPGRTVIHHRAVQSTNRWGYVDRDRPLEKPAGVRRLAFFGSSYLTGDGVDYAHRFSTLVERRLPGWEVLNFGASGHCIARAVVHFRRNALRFRTDLAVSFITPRDIRRAMINLEKVWENGYETPFPLPKGSTREQVLAASVQEIAREARRAAIPLVIAFLPVTMRDDPKTRDEVRRAAEEAGLDFIDLSGAYGQGDRARLMVAPWDSHPNIEGHARIARALLPELERVTSPFRRIP